MGGPADEGRHHAWPSSLQQEGASRQDRPLRGGRHGLRRHPRHGRSPRRPLQQEPGLHRVPLFVEPELLRLPLAAEGQQEDARPAQRGRGQAQLRRLQFPDPSRRRVHARPRRRRDRQQDRPGPLVVRHPRRFLQRQPRLDLRAAADDLRRRPQRHRLQQQRAAHRARRPPVQRPSGRATYARKAYICRAAARRPSRVPTATCPRTTTTTPSWPSS